MDIKISQYGDAATLTGNEFFEVVQGGANKKAALTKVIANGQGAINPQDYGCAMDGTTNDLTAFSNLPAGAHIYIPYGKVLKLTSSAGATTIKTLAAGQNIFGGGKIRISGNNMGIQPGKYSVIDNIIFEGDGKAAGHIYQGAIGCDVVGNNLFRIQNCIFRNFAGTGQFFGGAAITMHLFYSGPTAGATVINNTFENCAAAFNCLERAEYVRFADNVIDNCDLGAYIQCGNFQGTGNTIQNCGTAFMLRSNGNPGHGFLTSSTLNHNVTNLDINGIPNTGGFKFTNVMMYAGNIKIEDCGLIEFTTCDFVSGTITLINNSGVLQALGGRFPVGGTYGMTINKVSGIDFTKIYTLDY